MGVPDMVGASGENCAVTAVVEAFGGDPWSAVAALLEENGQLRREVDGAWSLVSPGYARGKRPGSSCGGDSGG
jgi:hypothetical protein